MRIAAVVLASTLSGCTLFYDPAVPDTWVGAPASLVEKLWPERSMIRTTMDDSVEILHFLDSYWGSSGQCPLLVIRRMGDGVIRGTMTYQGYETWHSCVQRSGPRGCHSIFQIRNTKVIASTPFGKCYARNVDPPPELAKSWRSSGS